MIIIPVPEPKWTFETLLALFKNESTDSRVRFEKIFDPVYIGMVSIHNAYRNMFNKALEVLPEHEDDEAFLYLYDENGKRGAFLMDTPIGSPDYLYNLVAVRKAFEDDRKKNDFLKMQSREHCVEILKQTSGLSEKKFTWSVIDYFLNQRDFDDDAFIEDFITRLIERRTGKLTDIPGYLFNDDILQSENAEEIRTYINRLKAQLNDLFVVIATNYIQLKLSVYGPAPTAG